jgi:hypothetical protein
MKKWMRCHLACLALLASTMLAQSAHAAGGDAAIAEDLFNDAKHLLEQGDTTHACPKFAESLRLDPTLGTRLNLAHCYEVAGKTASAWGEYKEVLRQAEAAKDSKRAQIAREHVAVVEAKLARVTLHAAGSDGVAFALDGRALESAVLGTPFPIDPGDHEIDATATGKKPYKSTFHVEAQSTSTVEIPALADLPVVVVPPAPAQPVAPAHPDQPPAESSGTKRTVGYIVGGAGIVAIGVGAYFGVRTLSLASDVSSACPNGPCSSPDAIDKNSTAHTDALISDITIGVGVVALAAGAYLILTSKPSHAASRTGFQLVPSASAHGGGAALLGRF